MHSFEAHFSAAEIPVGRILLPARLQVPPEAHGLVLFAHGSGGSRHSPRNQYVAHFLNEVGLATLLFDLLSETEEPLDSFNARLRNDIPLLAQRLRAATAWARRQPELEGLPIGYFGASNGAAAAMVAAVEEGETVRAVVTRGARPDLAGPVIANLRVPIMLIVGGNDECVAALNLEAWARLRCEKAIEAIPGVGALFEEPGALDNVAALAARWFNNHLQPEPKLIA